LITKRAKFVSLAVLVGVNLLIVGCGSDQSGAESEDIASDTSKMNSASPSQTQGHRIEQTSVSTEQEPSALQEQLSTNQQEPSPLQKQQQRDLEQDLQSFFWVQPGQTVINLSNGDSEYLEVLRTSLGEGGKLSDNGASINLRNEMGQSTDLLISNQTYHGLVANGVIRNDWLKQVHRILKPEGTFIVIDNAASQGEAETKAEQGRLEDDFVVSEVVKNGFDLVEMSDLFRKHPEGQSDSGNDKNADYGRFMLKFRKQPQMP